MTDFTYCIRYSEQTIRGASCDHSSRLSRHLLINVHEKSHDGMNQSAKEQVPMNPSAVTTKIPKKINGKIKTLPSSLPNPT